MGEGSGLREAVGTILHCKSIVENLPLAPICVCEDSVLGHKSRFALSPELVSMDLLPDEIISMDPGSLGNVKYAPLLLLYENLYL